MRYTTVLAAYLMQITAKIDWTNLSEISHEA